MAITSLKLTNFRNFNTLSISPGPEINLIYGDNGTGKTSLLEAIYHLGLGKSFRTHQYERVIQHQEESFSIYAELTKSNNLVQIGIERKRKQPLRVKLSGKSISGVSTLAKLIPIQMISTLSYRFFTDGPRIRRQFLDWGVFHVKPPFISCWQRLQHVLKQRNASLKSRSSTDQIELWNKEFCQLSSEIDQYRAEYIDDLKRHFSQQIARLLSSYNMELRYKRGWSINESLENILKDNLSKERIIGHTEYGPQRADLQIYINGIPAADILSQGQLKLTSYALQLAQGLLLHEKTEQHPIYLIDDLPSELDAGKREQLYKTLSKFNTQIFITAISQDLVAFFGENDAKCRYFDISDKTLAATHS